MHRRGLSAFSLAAVATAATACLAPPPAPVPQVASPTAQQLHTVSVAPAPSHRDVPYAAGASLGCGAGASRHDTCGGSQTLDVYTATVGSRGTIVFVHGGGYVGGDKATHDEDALFLRQLDRGWGVVAVNYRLANPTARTNLFPTQSNDVAAAIAWLRTNGANYGLNTAKVVTAGHSAGGTLAALAGVTGNNASGAYATAQRVDGWVSVSGIMAATAGPRSRFWSSQFVPDVPTYDRYISPSTFLDAADPAGYLVHGDRDTTVELAGTETLKRNADARGAQVLYDGVGTYADGTQMPEQWRGHYPSLGVNAATLDTWFDQR